MHIRVTFLSDWHISSGLGDSYRADAVLMRDADGFPYIPGRALKGALREGARRLGQCREDLRKAEFFFWGSRSDDPDANISGRLRVSAATLPASLKQQLAGLPDAKILQDDLTILHWQTALAPEGIVQPGSLRTTECAIAGLELEAELTAFPSPQTDENWVRSYFAAVCAAVKSIGGKRSRGFGQCKVSVDRAPRHVTLPPLHPDFLED